MTFYVVTYLELDLGRLEFHVDMIFESEDQACEYCRQQKGSDRTKINYEVHEVEKVN